MPLDLIALQSAYDHIKARLKESGHTSPELLRRELKLSRNAFRYCFEQAQRDNAAEFRAALLDKKQLAAVETVIQGLIAENPQYLYADIRALMVAAGFRKKVVGVVWREKFYRSRQHLEAKKKKRASEVPA